MVVVGLPAAGAVLVTGLVVIPPVAARQWTDRGSTLLLLAGLFGLAAAGAGVIVGAAAPRIAAAVGLQTPTGLATGPLVVLAAAAIAAVSFVAAPDRGWIVRGLRAAEERRRWTAGLILDACLRAAGDGAGRSFSAAAVRAATGGGRRAVARGWESLVREGIVAPESAADTWRLTETGRAVAAERRARIRGWEAAFDAAPAAAREAFSLELREPPR
jgi:manganese/zinc/iron transport system permease protein